MNDILNPPDEDDEPQNVDGAALPPDGEPLPAPSVSPTDQLGLELQMPPVDVDDLADEPPPLVLVEERPVEPVLLGDDAGSNDGGFLSMVPPGQPGAELPGTQPPLPEGLGLPAADQSIFPPGQPGAELPVAEPPPLPESLAPPPSGQGVIPPGQPGADLAGTVPPPPPEGLVPPTADQSVIPPGQPGGPGGDGAPPPPVIGDPGEPIPDVIAVPPVEAEVAAPPPLPPGLDVPPIENQSVVGDGQPGSPAPTDEAPAPPVIGDPGESLPDFIPVPLADAELGEPPPMPEGLLVPPVEDQSVVGDGQPTGQGDGTLPSPVPLPSDPPVATPASEPSSTPVTQPSTPVTVPVTTPVSDAATQPTSTSTTTPTTPAIVTPTTPITTTVTTPVSTPVTTPVTAPTSGPLALPTDPGRVPRPPEAGPNAPLPKPVNTNPVPPTIPDTSIPDIERPTVPPGPSPFRQDYSPDDRDALNRDPGRPTDDNRPTDDIERRQDWSPDDRDALDRDVSRPSDDIERRQDWSPDDRDVANRPAEIPDLPWDLPTIPELTIPDMGGPLDSPADAPADPLHGDPVAELEWAQVQSENGYCVPVSVGMIVSELTGTHHAEAELVQQALDLGVLYGEPGNWLGMTAEGAVALIESYDIEAQVEYGSVDVLRQYLDVGKDIILMVDADEIWYGDDDTNPIDAGMDHALVITAIDDASGIVYLNDPGQPQGAGFELSITALDDAWTDGGHQMVVTEAVGTGLGGAQRDAGGGAPAHAGFVLLPIVIAADVLRRVSPWARATGDVSES